MSSQMSFAFDREAPVSALRGVARVVLLSGLCAGALLVGAGVQANPIQFRSLIRSLMGAIILMIWSIVRMGR